MERRIMFLVLAALIAAVSCNFAAGKPEEKENPLTYPYKINVDNKTDIYCTLAKMDIKLAVEYKMKDGKVNTEAVSVPKNATSTGTCSPVVSELLLTWGEKDKENNVTFLLLNDNTMFSVVSVTLDLYSADFPNAVEHRVKKVKNMDTGKLAGNVVNGLAKSIETTVEFDKSSNMTMTNVSLIAFNNDKDLTKRKPETYNNTTIFDYIIPTNNETIATLAKMKITFEIPYKSADGSVLIYKQSFSNGQVKNHTYSNEGNKQSHWADLQWEYKQDKYKLLLAVREHDNGISYIDAVAVDIFIDKNNLERPAGDITRKGNIDLRLFPVALGNGLYSCKTGNILRFGDIKITLEDVLYAPFNSEKRWDARKVTVCDPKPPPGEKFNYVVNDTNLGVPCILGNMTIELDVTYKKKDNNTANAVIKVPTNASATGHCDEYMPHMDLTWPGPQEADKKDNMNKLRLSLYKNATTGLYYAYFVKADIYLNGVEFPDAADLGQYRRSNSNMTLRLFPNNMINGYYKCPNATEATIDETMKIKITDILLMAFNDQEDVSIKVKESGCFKDGNNGDNNDGNNGDNNGGNNGDNNGGNNGDNNGGNNGDKDKPKGNTTFDYYVNNTKTNVPCTLANMTISLKLNYQKADGTKEVTVNVPKNAIFNGTCADDNSVLLIMWPGKTKTDFNNLLKLTFGIGSSRFFLKAIETTITSEEGNFTGSLDNLMYFAADATSGVYKCESKVEVAASNFTAIFDNVVLIAFNENANYLKRSEENCSSQNVGAIVGGVIGGLVIIGIIGFVIFICRRNRY